MSDDKCPDGSSSSPKTGHGNVSRNLSAYISPLLAPTTTCVIAPCLACLPIHPEMLSRHATTTRRRDIANCFSRCCRSFTGSPDESEGEFISTRPPSCASHEEPYALARLKSVRRLFFVRELLRHKHPAANFKLEEGRDAPHATPVALQNVLGRYTGSSKAVQGHRHTPRSWLRGVCSYSSPIIFQSFGELIVIRYCNGFLVRGDGSEATSNMSLRHYSTYFGSVSPSLQCTELSRDA